MRKCFDNTSNVWLSLLYLSPQYIKYQTKVLRKQKLSFDTQRLSLSHLTKENVLSMNFEFIIPGSLNTSSGDISQTAAITTGHRVGQFLLKMGNFQFASICIYIQYPKYLSDISYMDGRMEGEGEITTKYLVVKF